MWFLCDHRFQWVSYVKCIVSRNERKETDLQQITEADLDIKIPKCKLGQSRSQWCMATNELWHLFEEFTKATFAFVLKVVMGSDFHSDLI